MATGNDRRLKASVLGGDREVAAELRHRVICLDVDSVAADGKKSERRRRTLPRQALGGQSRLAGQGPSGNSGEVAARPPAPCEDLVAQRSELVKNIARHLAGRLPATVDFNDLTQAGMVGLLEAAGNYDASRGASFETYAGIRIRGAMLDDIRKRDWTPRSVHHKYRQVTDAMQAVEQMTGRAASAGEVAKHMGISPEEYHKILADSAGSRLFSYEDTIEEPTLQRKPPSAGGPSPDEQLLRAQFREQLAEAIDQLPERERLVLSLYYERELNLKEIGAVLGISESRVCQIRGQAIMRLRAAAECW